MKTAYLPALFVVFASFFAQKSFSQPTGNITADTVLAWQLVETGDTLLTARKYAASLVLFDSARVIFEKNRVFSEKSGLCQEAVAMAKFRLGDVAGGMIAFEKAAETYQKVDGPPLLARVATCYNNLGFLASDINKYAQSNLYFEQSLVICLKSDDPCAVGLSNVYSNMGNNFQSLHRPREAIPLHEKAAALRERCSGHPSAQSMSNLASCYSALGEPYRAIELFEKARAAIDTSNEKQLPTLATIISNLAGRYSEIGQFEQALSLHEQSIALNVKLFGEANLKPGIAYNNLAAYFQDLGDHPRALDFLQKALVILEKIDKKSALAEVYNNLGVSFAELGDPAKALLFHEKSVAVTQEAYGPKHPRLADSYHNIACAHDALGDLDRAIEWARKAIGLTIESRLDTTTQMIQFEINLGDFLEKRGDFRAAKTHFERAQALAIHIYSEKSRQAANADVCLAKAIFWGNDAEKAVFLAARAIQARREIFGETNIFTARAHATLAKIYEEKNDWPLAEKSWLATFDALGKSPDDVQLLTQIGDFYLKWGKKTGNPTQFEAARNFYQKAATALDAQARTVSPGSKVPLAKAAHALFGQAVEANFALFFLKKDSALLREAFTFSERARAILLLEGIVHSNAQKIAGIPAELLEKERGLRLQIAFFEQKKASATTLPDPNFGDIGGRLFQLNRSLDSLVGRFGVEFPEYFRAKFSRPIWTVEMVQKGLLKPGQSLIEYMVLKDSFFVFLVNKSSFSVHKLPKNDLDNQISKLTVDGIYGYWALPKSQRSDARLAETEANFDGSAQKIHDLLLAPIASGIAENLIIVPDGGLHLLPFEALLTVAPTRAGAFNNYPFLVREKTIQYAFSASYLAEMTARKPVFSEKNVLGMAPFFRGDTSAIFAAREKNAVQTSLRDEVGNLPASGAEVGRLMKTWGGKPAFGLDATAGFFKENAPKYPILHLSTHAKTDFARGDFAFLAFADPVDSARFDPVFASEIYEVAVPAELVFIAACESGVGAARLGDAPVSLGRAFAFAGAKSIFSSLWKVNDAKTTDLTLLFYENMGRGLPKDRALAEAKRAFLGRESARFCHPFFWAAMVGNGDMSPINR